MRAQVDLPDPDGPARTTSAGTGSRRRVALAGLVGPAAFVGAWVTGGILSRSRGYSPVHDAISRLAAAGAPTQPLMSTGFVVFGLALPVFGAAALRREVDGPAWASAVATGLATLGVAAFPLDVSAGVDVAHGIAAGTGYATLAAVPLLAARPLWREGRRGWAAAGVVAGLTSAVCLALTTSDLPHGLFQRLGLTVTDTWIAAFAISLAVRRTPARGRPSA